MPQQTEGIKNTLLEGNYTPYKMIVLFEDRF